MVRGALFHTSAVDTVTPEVGLCAKIALRIAGEAGLCGTSGRGLSGNGSQTFAGLPGVAARARGKRKFNTPRRGYFRVSLFPFPACVSVGSSKKEAGIFLSFLHIGDRGKPLKERNVHFRDACAFVTSFFSVKLAELASNDSG